MTLADIIQNNSIVPVSQLKPNNKPDADKDLLKEIQTKLNVLDLYPAGRFIDGLWGGRTEKALNDFCGVLKLTTMTTGKIDKAFAAALLDASHTPISIASFRLSRARDRQKILNEYLEQEKDFNSANLAFLDKGIESSPYRNDINSYPDRLKEKPDGIEVVSLGETFTPVGSSTSVPFNPYPATGETPQIRGGLDFLDSEIEQACVCVGSFVDGQIKAHWIGKNALSPVEFWSATKIIPVLSVICDANSKDITHDIDNCVVRQAGSATNLNFHQLVKEMVGYTKDGAHGAVPHSNAIAGMFKRFHTFQGLEAWVESIAGKASRPKIEFSGNYGAAPLFDEPLLLRKPADGDRQFLLKSAPLTAKGANSLSAYDLTRFTSMLAWHHHLPKSARLPNAQWHSLESVVRAMGYDTARYVDVAIKQLGLSGVIKSPVIISKLGFGRSAIRDRTEATYTAAVQFVDQRPRSASKPAKLRTVVMTLKGAVKPGTADDEARVVDAKMAAAVTEILRRVVEEEQL